ncbi:hypothetical protein Acy02nite_83200 [Actinoplanes cyaneus]|uniref:Uncharacterized protein n=1 Tax=Actinoplanes cyaneus TaxID=52696 RepID=A0A919IQP3_9ACTN|nr:SMI1/KNR4 family protein [Actinoplanes cyaneus]MCW2143106.1 hypothetical protein [Actinoplanes cyaneus]GID70439.1 hypothetical protein Acy02nite_83200 [Actinoplanes cyaneus]
MNVEKWRADVQAAAADLAGSFTTRFGFAPDEYVVGGPATAQELAGLAGLHGDALPAELLALYRVVAEVGLPDVGNGYWIHRPPLPGQDPGHPRRLSDGRPVVVFGSDGGGTLFALPGGAGGPVLAFSGGELSGGAYEAGCATPVAADLPTFLTAILHRIPDGLG